MFAKLSLLVVGADATAKWGNDDFKALRTKICTVDIPAVKIADTLWTGTLKAKCKAATLTTPDKAGAVECDQDQATQYMCETASGTYFNAGTICTYTASTKKCGEKTGTDAAANYTQAVAWANAVCAKTVTDDAAGTTACEAQGVGKAPATGDVVPATMMAGDAWKHVETKANVKVDTPGTCIGTPASYFPKAGPISGNTNIVFANAAGMCTTKGMPYSLCKRTTTTCGHNLPTDFGTTNKGCTLSTFKKTGDKVEDPCSTTTTTAKPSSSSSGVRSVSAFLTGCSMLAAAIMA